jgi:hypothetical protein
MSYKGSIVIGRKAPCPFNTSQFTTGASFTIAAEALRVVLARAGDWRDLVQGSIGVGDNTMVLTTAFHYALAGTGYSKASVETDLTATEIPETKFGGWVFSISSAGTVTCTGAADNTTGYDTAALARTACNTVETARIAAGDFNEVRVILQAQAGGFTPQTDALSLATSIVYETVAEDGFTLDDDFNPNRGAITGFHKASIDTTESILGGAPGDELLVLLGAGTVDSVSATGKLLAQYTLAGSTLEANSIDLAALAADLKARLLSATAVTALDRAFGVKGTIGATGNDTTHLHLDGLTYGNDEINDRALIVYDDSEAEYHFTWITDWVLGTELATVETLPFTPEASVDTYVLLPVHRKADLRDTPNATAVAKWFTTALTEAYSTDAGTLTPAQALYELVQRSQEIAISGTTMLIKKRDGTTTAFTLTLGDATNPTSVTRAS